MPSDPGPRPEPPPTERVSVLGRARRSAVTPAEPFYEEAGTEAFPTGYAATSAEPFYEEAGTEAFPVGYAATPSEAYSQEASQEAWTQALPTGYAATPAEPFYEEAGTETFPVGHVEEPPRTMVLPASVAPGAGRPVTSAGYGPASAGYSERPAPPRQRARREPRPAARPQRLPPEMRAVRQRTAALPLGTFFLVASVLLLGWGIYTFLVSIDVFSVIRDGAQVVYWPAAAAAGAGALLAFFALIAAFVAVSRARPRTAASFLLLGVFVLPLASTVGAAYYGGTVLKDRTLTEAHEVAGQVDTTQVEEALDRAESRGIPVPWRDEVWEILRTARGEGSQ